MADLRAKEILESLTDNISRANYGIDKVGQYEGVVKRGDTLQVGQLSALSVVADGNVSTSAQSATLTALDLVVDRHPAIFLDLPKVADWQLLGGTTKDQFGKNAAMRLKSYMDDEFCQYLAYTLSWLTGAAGVGDLYHRNPAADTVAAEDFANAMADLESIDGVHTENIACFIHPFCEASLRKVGGIAPSQNTGLGAGQFGLPMVGLINGVPAYKMNSIPRNKAVATTACTVTSNVATATVAAGHGLTPGQLITTSLMTTNATSAVAITSTTATTVVYPLTAADGALADGIGLITEASCWNMVLDTSDIYVAQSIVPQVEIVKPADKTGWVLQCSSLWGRIGRAGKVRIVHTPGSNA